MVRQFSLNLRFLGPRAYDYLRNKFDNNLPHPGTIRKWFALGNLNGGKFHDLAFQTLKELAQTETIYAAISFDEMSIRRHVQWLQCKKKFAGYVNFATLLEENDPLPIATHAIVIMLNGINVKVTLPIAYFFITTLIAEEKAILIASVIKALTEIGIRVLTITSDGLASNFAAYEILGASLAHDNLIPYFTNQDDGKRVYIFLDPAHKIKLIRNCLGDEKILHDGSNRPIEWKFIDRLYRTKSSGIASHRLTKRHIDWKSNPMKVVLATQTLSMSVAQSIAKLAQNGVSQFKGSEGTVEFIMRCDNSFNIFNSDKYDESNVYKSPITEATKQTIFDFMDETITYFDGLTLKGKKITVSSRNTGFKGTISNMIALKNLHEEIVDSKLIPQLRTTSIQQDFLESFFGRMRSKCGDNSNPTQEQFVSNFSRILANQELTSSTLSNCLDKLDILVVSSNEIRSSSSSHDFIMIANATNSESEEETLAADLIFDITPSVDENLNQFEETEHNIDAAELLGIVNLAGQIEARIERNERFNCNDCCEVFENNVKVDTSLFVRNKKNILPCESTFEICKIGSKTMDNYFKTVHESRFNYEKLVSQIKNKIRYDELYTRTNFDHNQDHKSLLIDFVIEELIRIQAVHRARIITLNQQKTFIRSAKTHDINFAGQ